MNRGHRSVLPRAKNIDDIFEFFAVNFVVELVCRAVI